MASRQQEFVNQVYNDARAAGLPDAQARLAASQAALETGYGKSVAGNNYFGIKAGSSWNGPTVNVKTWEEVGGQPVSLRDNFRSYSSPIDSLKDWANTMERRWSGAMSAPTFEKAVQGLNAGRPGGYATDSKYGQKLGYINETFSPDPRGIMAVIDAPTPSPAPGRASLGAVQRSPLENLQPSFDPERFGPAPFDAGRFGIAGPGLTGKAALQRGLLDQQLNVGILPQMPPPVEVAPAPPVQVSVQQPMAAQPAVRAVDPRMTSATGMLGPTSQQMQAAQKMQRDMTMRNALGAVGGAILGGALLGPIGGLLGGFVGKGIANNSYYPDAPQGGERNATQAELAAARSLGQFDGKGEGGSWQDSKQTRDAMSSGKGGLW